MGGEMNKDLVVYWVDFESWKIIVPKESRKEEVYQAVMDKMHRKIFPEIVFMEIDVRPPLRLCDPKEN